MSTIQEASDRVPRCTETNPGDILPWRSTLFSVIGPDAVRRHLARPIIERYRQEGLAVVGWQSNRITPVLLDGVYEEHLVSSADAYRYRALDAKYALGPSIALRLAPPHADNREISHWYWYIKTVKGPSAPADTKPGCIRHDLGAINTVLSLVHASDSPEHAARESSILLDGKASSWRCPSSLDGFLDVSETHWRKETRGFTEVLSELRAGIVSHLWPSLSSEGQLLASQLTRAGQLATPDAGERIRAHLVDWRAGYALLEVLAARFDPSTAPLDIGTVERALIGVGLALDDWSRTVLDTSMFFEPRRLPLPEK